MEDRKVNAPAKIEAIVHLIFDELAVYPGDAALRFINKILEILDGDPDE